MMMRRMGGVKRPEKREALRFGGAEVQSAIDAKDGARLLRYADSTPLLVHTVLSLQSGPPLLIEAVKEGHEPWVRALLGAGVVVDDVDDRGWSAMAHAMHSGRMRIVLMLLESGVKASDVPWMDNDALDQLHASASAATTSDGFLRRFV